MNVDPDALREFAASLTRIAEAMVEWDTAAPFERSLDALPGTELRAHSVAANQTMTLALGNVCTRLLEIVDASNGAADDYEIAEDEFVSALTITAQPR